MELFNSAESSFKLGDRSFALLENPGNRRRASPGNHPEIRDPLSEFENLRYWGYPCEFALQPFPSLRLFRTFHKRMGCIFPFSKTYLPGPLGQRGSNPARGAGAGLVGLHPNPDEGDSWEAL